MKVLSNETKFAHLGKPGTAFTKGFQRRMDIMKKHIDFSGKKILDLGCGEGVWLEEFAKEAGGYEFVYGSEFDKATMDIAIANNPKLLKENLKNCPGEALDFSDHFFDIVFQNEVLEHVQDDVKTISESLRVLKQGGKLVLFTPNRFWPFEQHGMFIGKKYIWGNIPFLPWMPRPIYKIFAPHVKNYWPWELKNILFKGANLSGQSYRIQLHTQIFPGFDGAIRKLGIFGKLIQKLFLALEKTPLKIYGISHLLIVEKV